MGFAGFTSGFSAGLRGGDFSIEPTPALTTLSATNGDAPDPVNAGQNITYTIQLTVTGAADAVSVVGTITLDAAVTFVSNTGTGWTFTRVGQVITARIDMIPSGLAPVITVVATSPSGSSTTVTTTSSFVAANVTSAATANATTNVTGAIAGVTRDATNLNYYPASASEWTTFMTAIGLATGNPGNVWAMQGTGNASDTGAGGCTLTNTFDAAQQAVTGASRVGYKSADAGNSEKLVGTTGAPNPRTTSTLLLAYVDFNGLPAAARDFMGVQTGSDLNYLSGSGKLRIVASGSTDGTSDYHGTQGWVALRCNITNSTITCLTNLEKFSGTFVLPNNGSAVWFGGHTGLVSNACYAYGAEFAGSAAELTDAQVKTLLQGLGATIPWS